ncbi:MAG: EAL and HDOD domain-containing protein, partial [Actinomycetota bacterium]
APLDAFLGGMLSLLEAILDEPSERLLDQISAGPAVRAALLEGSGALGDLLATVAAYERGDLASVAERAEAHGITPGMLFGSYLTALTWADEHLPAAE